MPKSKPDTLDILRKMGRICPPGFTCAIVPANVDSFDLTWGDWCNKITRRVDGRNLTFKALDKTIGDAKRLLYPSS